MFSLYSIYHLLTAGNHAVAPSILTERTRVNRDRKRYLESILGKQQDDASQASSLEIRLNEYLLTYGGARENVQFLFPNIPEYEPKAVERRKDLQKEAEKNFAVLSQKYRYDLASYAEEYFAYVQVLHYVAHVIEQNYVHEELYERAYQLMVTFYEQPTKKNQHTNIFSKLEQHLKGYWQSSNKPIHDLAVSYKLPLAVQSNGTRINIKAWRNIIDKKGKKALKLFSRAHELTETPQSYEEALSAISALTYSRAAENGAFALLCQYYQVTEEEFNRSLDMLSNGKITLQEKDTLPTTDVRSEEIPELKEKYFNYHLLRLPKNDLRGLILGKLSMCCQHIGGAGEAQTIDGMHLENNGFYVLIQGKLGTIEDIESCKFIGQAYIWRGKHNNIVFDSWEITHPNDENKYITQVMVMALAKKILAQYPEISRITIGQGGKTKEVFADIESRACFPEFMRQGRFNGDANKQAELAISPKLAEIRAKFKRQKNIVLTDDFLKTLISVSFGEAMFKLTNDVLNFVETHLSSLPSSWEENEPRTQFTAHCIAGLEASESGKLDRLFRNLQKVYEEYPEKWDLLTSLSCFDACKNGASFLELLLVDNIEHLKFIIENCSSVFSSGIKTTELTYCTTIQEIKQKVLECYAQLYDNVLLNAREITDDTLLDLLISSEAELIYKEGARVLDCLAIAKRDQDSFQMMLQNYNVFPHLFREGVQSKDLVLLSKTQLKQLLTIDQPFLKTVGWNTFLSVKDEEFLAILTSQDARNAYHYGAKFSDLALAHNMELLKLLLSPMALKAYRYKADSAELAKSTSSLELKQKLLQFFAKHYNQGSDDRSIDHILSDEEILDYLLSGEAFRLYEQNSKNFWHLISLSKERLAYLLSLSAQRKFHPDFLNELIKIPDLSVVRKLVSSYEDVSALCYHGVKLSEIANMVDTDRWSILLSKGTQRALASHVSFSDLTSVSDPLWLQQLISHDACCYQYVPFKELASARSFEHLQVLTSHNAAYAYRAGAKFSDLNTVEDITLLQFLVCLPSTQAAYQKGGSSAELVQCKSLLEINTTVLKIFTQHYHDQDSSFITSLTATKVELLISSNAETLYEVGIKPSQLATVRNEACLAHLLSSMVCYSYKELPFMELLAIEDLNQLQFLSSLKMIPLYQIGATVAELASLDLQRLAFFQSEEVLKICNCKGITFEDIKQLRGKEHAESILRNILVLVRVGATISDCIKLPPERLQFLSQITDFLSPYRYKVTFADLLSIPGQQHVNLLTSLNANHCYAAGISFGELASETNLQRLEFLISSQAYSAYQMGGTVKDLKKIQTIEQLNLLTEYHMQRIYQQRYVSFSDLAAVADLKCLKILIAFYKKEPTIHSKALLKVTDAKCLELLTSDTTLMLCEYYGIPFEELLSVTDSKHIEQLISWPALEAYKAGVDIKILKQVTRSRSGLPDASQDIPVPLTPSVSERLIPSAATVPSNADDLTPSAIAGSSARASRFPASSDATCFAQLVSPEALACYKLGAQANDFAEANTHYLPLLLSRNAQSAYRVGVSSKDLAQAKDSICLELLLSWNAIALYRHGLDAQTLSIGSSPLFIKKEMLKYIIQNYPPKDDGEIEFIEDLEDHAMLDVLISPDAREAFEKGLNCKDLVNSYSHPAEAKKAIEEFLLNKPKVQITHDIPLPVYPIVNEQTVLKQEEPFEEQNTNANSPSPSPSPTLRRCRLGSG